MRVRRDEPDPALVKRLVELGEQMGVVADLTFDAPIRRRAD